MNSIERFLDYLNSIQVEAPTPWGALHIACLAIIAVFVTVFVYCRRRGITISPNKVFAIYGFSSLVFELLKQLMWSMNVTDGAVTWSYSWYSAPFQFCTMPMYIALVLCFIKNEKLREYLYDFLGFFSIISMTMVMLVPNTVFTTFEVVNIHTMILHGGGLIVALFVLINRLTPHNAKSVMKGFAVFVCLAAIALAMDIAVEKSGINNGAEFNMFYISPYYPCRLPVFVNIQNAVPYPLFLLSYLFSMLAGGFIVLGITRAIRCITQKKSIEKSI